MVSADRYEVDDDVLASDAQAPVDFISHLLVEISLPLERSAACERKLDENAIGETLDPREVRIENKVRRRLLVEHLEAVRSVLP